MTDVHTHILYGVDDGAPDEENALKTLQYLENEGVKKIFLTPHIMADIPQNRPQFLRQRFETLQNAYQGDIQLVLAGEYMLDNLFETHLNDPNEKILSLSDYHLLVETSYLYQPINLSALFEAVKRKGFYIILAHPERYVYMDKRDYAKWKADPFLSFQLDLLSLTGGYGKEAQEKARYLLKNDCYAYVGSDIHHLERHRTEYNNKALTAAEIEKVRKLIDANNSIE